jgi:isocitrate dehydrogenase kinase/phosphatase
MSGDEMQALLLEGTWNNVGGLRVIAQAARNRFDRAEISEAQRAGPELVKHYAAKARLA